MRNLKKILALALAFIMSLSLMVTAGAKDFPDSAGITNDAYALAVDILSDLDVFNGDQNGNFNPTQPITRAEVAAIIYRIATGDVGVDGYKTYAPYNQFKDIDVEDWYAGYVTYCANAGYIKGRNTGNFDAKDDVTGYEVLAMILRAVGYDKNGEFVGSNWQLNTASIATEKGVLSNVLKDGTVRLSEPASRQVVAEMLFRAIQINTVTWNANTLSYVESGETLALKNLGMESITGVVMANKWANINQGGDTVLAEGKTQLKPEGRAAVTLDIDTTLDAVGCSYTAYIQNETRVLGELEYCEDLNTVVSNDGAKATVASLLRSGSMTEGDAEYFLNYSEDLGEVYYTLHVIRYAIAEDSCTEDWVDYITSLVKRNDGTDVVDGHSYETREITINDIVTNCYVVTIQPNNWVTEEDYEIMRRIFFSADRLDNNAATDTGKDQLVVGEVYVGTNSTVDVSDWNPNTNTALSWWEFVDTYLHPSDAQYVYSGCENGESLRVISNDGDSVADYVFKIEYWQDKAFDSEKDELLFYELEPSDYDYETWEDEIAVGDVVNYTSIDGRVTVYKADMITGKVTEKDFEKKTILTTANDTVYGQSEIYNNTFMDDQILQTDEETEYNFYLDEYGYIRTYERTSGSRYALVTEVYNTTNQAYNYVTSNRYIAEVKAGEADVDEFVIANPVNNPFISESAWTSRITNQYVQSEVNYLQPAIAHLGVSSTLYTANRYYGATNGSTAKYNWSGTGSWNRGVFEMVPADKTTDYGVFDYGKVTGKYYDDVKTDPVDHSFSFTNVATYSFGDNDTVSLYSATKLKTDRTTGAQLYYWQPNTGYAWADVNGLKADPDIGIGRDSMTLSQWRAAYAKSNGLTDTTAKDAATITAAINACLVEVYEVDYVQLQKEGIKANMRHFNVDETYEANFRALSNGYVNATVETEFYIATPTEILYYVGYDKLPTISASHVRAAYAVATNAYKDSSDYDYWIANVIVIEVDQLDNPYDSISLMYYNPNEISGSVRNLRSLNNQWRTYQPDSDDEAKINVVPKTTSGTGAGSYTWGNASWNSDSYGFYEIYDSTYADGTLTAGDVQKLDTAIGATNWAGHHIYAGTIQRIWGLTTSEYIDVDYLGRDINDPGAPFNDSYVQSVTVTTSDSAVPIYRVNGTNTTDLRLGKRVSSSDIALGDQLILVYNKAGTALSYIVDLGYRYYSSTSSYDPQNTANLYYLWDNYQAIVAGQKNSVTSGTMTLRFNLALGVGETAEIVYENETQGSYKYVSAGTQPAYLTIPSGSAIVTFQVKLGGGAAPFAVVPNAPWTCLGNPVWNSTTNTMTVKLLNTSVANASGKSAILLDASAAGTLFTVRGLQDYADNIVANAGTMTAEQLEVASAVLAGVQDPDNQPVNTAGTPTSPDDDGKISLAETAIGTRAGALLPDIKDAANDEVDAYEATKVALLTGSAKTAAASAKSTATSAISGAGDAAAVQAAVDAYKAAIDGLIEGLDEIEDLTATKNAAKDVINGGGAAMYEKAAVEALTGDAADSALMAQSAAITAIDDATDIAGIEAAVNTYKAAIDKLITVTVSFTGANATVKISGTAVTSKAVTAGTSITFTVDAAAGYNIESVKAGEATLTPAEGNYTCTITEDTTITVTTAVATTVTVAAEEGYTPSSIKGGTLAQYTALGNVWPTLTVGSEIDLGDATSVSLFIGDSVGAPSVTVGSTTILGTETTSNVYGYIINNIKAGDVIMIGAPLAPSVAVTNPDDGTIDPPSTSAGQVVKYALVEADPTEILASLTIAATASVVNAALSTDEDPVTLGSAPTLAAADNGKWLVAVILSSGETSATVEKAGCVKIAYAAPETLTFGSGWVTVGTGVIDDTEIKNDGGALTGAKYVIVESDPAEALASITVMDGESAVVTALTPKDGDAPTLDGSAPTLTKDDNGSYLVVIDIDSSKVIGIGIKEIADITNQ